jgi:hypothetical protein
MRVLSSLWRNMIRLYSKIFALFSIYNLVRTIVLQGAFRSDAKEVELE